MRVSLEITCLEWRGAVDQARGWRKVARGVVGSRVDMSPSLRVVRAAASRVPMW